MSFSTKKELELSPSPNLYYSSTRTCEATPPVEGESEAKEKLHAGKQDTKKLLERMRELKAEAEKAIDELESELQNITVATNELKELRALVDEKKTELRQGLQLPANYKEETYVEQPRASNEHKKEVDNTKRPLLKRIKGLFGSVKSTKRKKEVQGLPLQVASRQAERLTTPEAKTSQDEPATPEAKTTNLVDQVDSELTLYAKSHQREEFEIERSGLRRRPRSFERIEIEGSALRRKRSSGEVSVVSVEIALPRRGSQRSLPTAYVGLNFLDELEDPDDFKEPIKIIKHPKSQTVKEGSKVQLECKLEKKSQHFLYQWYRDDGSAVIGKSESVLVLDQVELKDFGSYHCRVSYEDSFGEGEVSKPAKLEVKPIPGRNGKRLKCLSDVDYSTMDCVATLLGSEKPGLGDWRGIGVNYGMEAYEIDALVNEAPVKRGRMVLEYLQTSKPNLTVFDFCRTLKEDTFKRFDIVKKLENHFLVSI